MSTTNPPPPGGHQQGAGPNWPADAAHGSAPDDHGGGGGASREAIAAGHEPDAFAVKPILSVPLAVVATFVVAFGVAAAVFAYVMAPTPPGPFMHPEAVARSEQPTNERLLRTERQGQDNDKWREVDQPRLEPLKRLEKNGEFFARTEMPTGNSPQIHPEEIRPDRVAGLQRTGFVDGEKKYARVPIAEAMKLAVEGKTLFPVRKLPSKPPGTADKPSASSAGTGVMPPAPKDEAKKDQNVPAPKPSEAPKPAEAPKPNEPKANPPEKKQ